MIPYAELPELIARAIMALDTAITEHERTGAQILLVIARRASAEPTESFR